MSGSEGSSKSYDSSQIMQAELQNHLEEFRRSEQLGENRLNIYLTIVTAVLGGSGFLVYFQAQDGVSKLTQIDLRIIFFACLATLMFGVLTLLRMIHRNLISSEELRAASRIRRYFVERDGNILKYLKYPPCDDKPVREWKWKNGGLVDTVVLLNAFLMAIIMVTLMAIRSQYLEIVSSNLLYGFAGLLGFSAAWTLQFIFTKDEYNKAMEKIEAIFPSNKRELEAAIVVASDYPEPIVNEFKRLTSIGGYILLCAPTKNIHDRYFDTKGGDLNNQKLALRIREINGDMLLTLKGPSVPSGAAMQRMEIEEKWSHQAFKHVREELRCRGIEVSLPDNPLRNDMMEPSASQDLTPSEIIWVMSRYGLNVIQDRETNRAIRNVVSERDGPILAELSIDRVSYHFKNEKNENIVFYYDAVSGNFCGICADIVLWLLSIPTPNGLLPKFLDLSIVFYEVEIENKVQGDGPDVIGKLATIVQERYPIEMRRWKYSKLEIGKAIKEISLFDKGYFLEIINDKKDRKSLFILKAAAFDEIDRHIREKKKEMQ